MMKEKLANTLLWLALAILIAGTLVLCISSRKQDAQKVCTNMRVYFKDDFNFVTEGDIKTWLESGFGHYVGQKLDSMDLCGMEVFLDGKTAIRKSEVYTTPDGAINIIITQREPVLRFQKKDIGFYVDERGYVFPLQKRYEARVPLVSGNIPVSCGPGYKGELKNAREAAWMRSIIALMDYISNSRRWSGYSERLTVEENGDIVLKALEGKEKIIIGSPDRIEEKFEFLGKYYDVIRPSKPDGYYATVNLKYRGQIVCRR